MTTIKYTTTVEAEVLRVILRLPDGTLVEVEDVDRLFPSSYEDLRQRHDLLVREMGTDDVAVLADQRDKLTRLHDEALREVERLRGFEQLQRDLADENARLKAQCLTPVSDSLQQRVWVPVDGGKNKPFVREDALKAALDGAKEANRELREIDTVLNEAGFVASHDGSLVDRVKKVTSDHLGREREFIEILSRVLKLLGTERDYPCISSGREMERKVIELLAAKKHWDSDLRLVEIQSKRIDEECANRDAALKEVERLQTELAHAISDAAGWKHTAEQALHERKCLQDERDKALRPAPDDAPAEVEMLKEERTVMAGRLNELDDILAGIDGATLADRARTAASLRRELVVANSLCRDYRAEIEKLKPRHIMLQRIEELLGEAEEWDHEEDLHDVIARALTNYRRAVDTVQRQKAELSNERASARETLESADRHRQELQVENARLRVLVGGIAITPENPPLPDGVPVECWVLWYAEHGGNAFARDPHYTGPHKIAHYVPAAAVEREREECAEALTLASREAWVCKDHKAQEVLESAADRIRARGKR